LIVCATEATAFEGEELDVLTGVAADVAFGLTILRGKDEQMSAEKALRESECKYRELVELAKILGRHVVGTIVPETESTSRDLRPLMEQIAADPKAFEQNINENMRRSGERVWIAWTNKTVLDSAGHVKEILSIGHEEGPVAGGMPRHCPVWQLPSGLGWLAQSGDTRRCPDGFLRR
jgi:hypothetical protein